jgi:hypothetical protein
LSRIYDRNQGASPADPYYSGGLPQGPPAHIDPYQNYDPYQKFYPNRPRESEFSVPASQNVPSRFVLHCSLSMNFNFPSFSDYNTYSNYRGDPYAASLRPDLTVLQVHQHHLTHLLLVNITALNNEYNTKRSLVRWLFKF